METCPGDRPCVLTQDGRLYKWFSFSFFKSYSTLLTFWKTGTTSYKVKTKISDLRWKKPPPPFVYIWHYAHMVHTYALRRTACQRAENNPESAVCQKCVTGCGWAWHSSISSDICTRAWAHEPCSRALSTAAGLPSLISCLSNADWYELCYKWHAEKNTNKYKTWA